MGHKSEEMKAHGAHLIPSPILLSGTAVAGGEGKFVVLMVGSASVLGQIMSKLKVTPEETPL